MGNSELLDTQASASIETLDANLPAIAEEAQAAWKQIEQSSLGDRMKRALQRIASGESIRGAAEAEGYSGHADVYRYAKRFGLVDVRTKAIINAHRAVAKLAGEELERRLANNPDEIKTPQLSVIGGIATDKVLAHEKSQADGGGSAYVSALEAVAAKIVESGASLEIQVSVSPTASGAAAGGSREPIDVTPEP